VFICGSFRSAEPAKRLDPAAWGGDHVGRPVPEFVTGEECLFCHRQDVGPAWPRNRHHLTLRAAEPGSPPLLALKQAPALEPVAGEVTLVLGGNNRVRFLKPTGEYGQLALHSAAWVPPRGTEGPRLIATGRPHWDPRTFGDACAGCHATGVDPRTRAFSTPSLDCYVCHGDVNLKHSEDPALVLLARKRNDPARVVTSICAQCHVRTGQSRSTGRPYPTNFVAGDNLFRDFQVDLADEHIRRLNPGDRHVLENVREVVLLGKDDVTCLSCHDVHRQSGKKHHRVAESDVCLTCHHAIGSKKVRKPYEVHSLTCGY
jgi:predicted CXXCH cytochrome family protein